MVVVPFTKRVQDAKNEFLNFYSNLIITLYKFECFEIQNYPNNILIFFNLPTKNLLKKISIWILIHIYVIDVREKIGQYWNFINDKKLNHYVEFE